MSHKKKRGGGGAQNFWPGYVDALTNVVLNLLFMVAIFGIAVAVFSALPHTGEGEGGGAPPPGGPALANAPASPAPGADRAAPRLPAIGGQGSAGSSLSAAGPSRGAPAGSSAEQGQPAGLNFTVVDAYRRSGGPDTQFRIRPQANGGTLFSVAVPNGDEPTTQLAKPRVGLALKAAMPAQARRFTVWSASAEDPAARRIAYFAVVALRNQLIGLGVPETAIETRIYDGSASAADGLHVFVLASP